MSKEEHHQHQGRVELPRIPEHAARDIIKALTEITSTGHRPNEIFDDWLMVTEATLDMLPTHLKSAASTGQLATDTPEVAETWAKLRQKYGEQRWVFDRFAEAFGMLINGAYLPDSTPTYTDFVGNVFMEWGHPSKWAGQFFTSWTVAKMMAQMMGGEADVNARLKTAIAKSPMAEAMLLAGTVLEGDEARNWMLSRVIPAAIEHYEPVTVLDPAVGSGIMLLAHASTMPRWMVTTGLVRYYGCDIDATCVHMAHVNFKLYGLNGHHLKSALELTPKELAQLPQPHATAYTEAQRAHFTGDTERVEEIAAAIRGNQLNLFGND